MITTCSRAAAAALAMCCGLLLATPWQAAQAAPIVLTKATANSVSDDSGSFTASFFPGSNGDQALLQLFTAADASTRITGLYLQDATGAIARDTLSGYPKVQLSQTQVYELLLNDPGTTRLAVVKALSDALGISPSEANALVSRAPVVIRTASTPDGNDQLKQSLQSAGASVTLRSHQDPSVPAGTNVGVTTPGSTPTGFDVVLTNIGTSKLAIVKVVRNLTGLGLAEAEVLVDNVPSVIKASVSRADAIEARQALQEGGATVRVDPIGTGTAGPFVLPPGSTGIVPDTGLSFEYQDPNATPTLQLTLDLDIAFADLLAAWEDGQFLLGLKVTDAAGISDLYLAAVASPPAQVPEPPTLALLSLPLLVLLMLRKRRGSDLRVVPATS